MSRYRNNASLAPVDVTMNTLMGFILMFILTLIIAALSKAEQDEKKIDTSGEFLVLVTWDDNSGDDVDTHLRDPAQPPNHLYYNKREAGLLHLERDDRGKFNDSSGFDLFGKPIEVNKNEERAIIRGIVPGEYIVNIHMFRKVDKTATKVKVVLMKLKGPDTPITEKELTFTQTGDEQTAFRFTLNAAGEVSKINHLPRKFIGQSGQPSGSDPENPEGNPNEEDPR